MPDNAKEWVTVKVPREAREHANGTRPEGATYGDCLRAGAEVLARDDSESMAMGPPPSGKSLDGSRVGGDVPDDGLNTFDVFDPVPDIGDLREDHDDLRDALATVEARTGRIERTLEEELGR